MQSETKQGESIFDLSLRVYGAANYAVKLVSENQSLQDYSFDTALIGGIVFEYDDQFKATRTDIFPIPKTPPQNMTVNYTVAKGQSIYDLALMWGYGIEGLINFAVESGIDTINEDDISGEVFLLPKKINNTSKKLILSGRKLATQAETPAPIINTASNILLETGDDILLETGDLILLE